MGGIQILDIPPVVETTLKSFVTVWSQWCVAGFLFICLFVLFFKLCYAIQNYKNQRGKNKSLFRDLENLKCKLKKGLKSGKFPSNSSSGLNLTSYIFRHVTVDSIMARCFTVPSLVCEKGRKNTPELQYWVLIFGVALSQLLGWGLNTFKHMFWDLRPGAKADMK